MKINVKDLHLPEYIYRYTWNYHGKYKIHEISILRESSYSAQYYTEIATVAFQSGSNKDNRFIYDSLYAFRIELKFSDINNADKLLKLLSKSAYNPESYRNIIGVLRKLKAERCIYHDFDYIPVKYKNNIDQYIQAKKLITE